MRSLIIEFCKSRTVCQMVKKTKSNFGELKGTLICLTPFHIISSDLFGPIDLWDLIIIEKQQLLLL